MVKVLPSRVRIKSVNSKPANRQRGDFVAHHLSSLYDINSILYNNAARTQFSDRTKSHTVMWFRVDGRFILELRNRGLNAQTQKLFVKFHFKSMVDLLFNSYTFHEVHKFE